LLYSGLNVLSNKSGLRGIQRLLNELTGINWSLRVNRSLLDHLRRNQLRGRSLNILNLWCLNILNLRLNILNLLDLRSLNLIFNFIVFDSFNLSRLSNIFSFILSNIFSSLNWNIFNFCYRNLFLDSIVFDSRNIFSLVFNCLVISPYFLSGDGFNYSSFNSFVFKNRFLDLIIMDFFNLFVFNFSSFNGVIFNSGFSFNRLMLSLRGLNILNLRLNI